MAKALKSDRNFPMVRNIFLFTIVITKRGAEGWQPRAELRREKSLNDLHAKEIIANFAALQVNKAKKNVSVASCKFCKAKSRKFFLQKILALRVNVRN